MITEIEKRDGRVVPFEERKVFNAVYKSFAEVAARHNTTVDPQNVQIVVDEVIHDIHDLQSERLQIDEMQSIVICAIKDKGFTEEFEAYRNFRNRRNRARNRKMPLYSKLAEITFSDLSESAIKRENGNIDGESAMGKMLRYGSEAAKEFFLDRIIAERSSNAHREGFIHIHDMDFYGITTTCTQIDLQQMLETGFNTGHGFVRPPQSIRTAAAQTAILIQSNQNDQHGGQSIPNFDLALAKYVKLSFNKALKHSVEDALFLTGMDDAAIKATSKSIFKTDYEFGMDDEKKFVDRFMAAGFEEREAVRVFKLGLKTIKEKTYQAMEALLFNLNTMHSRAGAQVPFSSINYGTETSTEARLVIRCMLEVTDAGLGHGETPIFPIQIFRVMDGVNYKEGDPNYDLFKLAIKVSAKRFFPNWEFQDSPFNMQYYVPGHPETMISTMGCRTRVMADVNSDRPQAWRRGNLSFTTINLPRLALLNKGNWEGFYADLDKYMELVKDQLLERYQLQCKQRVKNFKFLMGQHVWLDSEKLSKNDTLESVLKHGSLSIGFIGLAETLKVMTGFHHGESEEAQKKGLEIVKYMRDYCDRMTEQYKLNFTLLATPAEGLSGRFTKLDRAKFGDIPGITDKGFYTNSCHVPVEYPCSAFHKIQVEAPYHALCNAGHILYVHMDGDATKNLEAYEKIVRCMHDNNVGYGAVNIDVDYCRNCHKSGIFNEDNCPFCGSTEIDRIRRITGYLVGSLEGWNPGKKAEYTWRLKGHNT